MNFKTTVSTAIILNVIVAGHICAEPVSVRYDFNYLPARERARPSETSPELVVSDISFKGIGGGIGMASVFFFKPTIQSARNFEDAVGNDDFLEFTIAPADAASINMEKLSFRYGGENSTGAPPRRYTANFFVLSNLDGFSKPIGEPVSCIVEPGAGVDNVPNLFCADLGALGQFQKVGSGVTFRIYCYISELSGKFSETMRPRIDTLQLEGKTP